jgi:hypothetical protein
MYSTILVSEHAIEEGQRLLERLKKERFQFFAALWYHVPDSSQWVLVIATPVVSRVGPLAAYSRLQRILRGMNPSYLSLSDISLFSPASPVPHGFGMAPANGHTQDASPFGEAYVYGV